MLWTFFSIVLLFIISRTRRKKWINGFSKVIFSGINRIAGVRVSVNGEVSHNRPLLIVSNHISYLDITVLGSEVPICFTPKSDMAKWPVISSFCRMLGCIFIERTACGIKDARQKMRDTLERGDVLSLFPEGTTGNGRYVLPFKSSLFSIAEEKLADSDIFIQPAVISYDTIGGLPIDSSQWPKIAWYGDMYLFPHIWQLFKMNRIDVSVSFLPPVTLSQFEDRKEMAIYLRDEVVGVLRK